VAEDEHLDRQAAEEEEEEVPGEGPPLHADNFIGFLASWWRVVRLRYGQTFLAFAIGNLLVYAALLSASRTADADAAAVGILFFIGQFLLTAVVGGLLAAAAGYVRLEAIQGRRRSMLAGIAYVGDVWGHILGASVLTGLFAALLLLAVGLIGLFLGLPLRLGPPVLLFVIAFEKFGLAPAWSRTRALVKGNALKTFVYLLMLTLMAMVVLLLLQRVLEISLENVPLSSLGEALVFTGVTVLLYGLMDVALSAGLLVTYVDCRQRDDEDFTIDELTEEVETTDADPDG
jgi:hypothetical protein